MVRTVAESAIILLVTQPAWQLGTFPSAPNVLSVDRVGLCRQAVLLNAPPRQEDRLRKDVVVDVMPQHFSSNSHCSVFW